MSRAVKQMSEGELLQMEKSRSLNLDESVYYDIINGKTASLLASACAAGASTTFADDNDVEQMRLFGEKVGMAFQIKDDLFDYVGRLTLACLVQKQQAALNEGENSDCSCPSRDTQLSISNQLSN